MFAFQWSAGVVWQLMRSDRAAGPGRTSRASRLQVPVFSMVVAYTVDSVFRALLLNGVSFLGRSNASSAWRVCVGGGINAKTPCQKLLLGDSTPKTVLVLSTKLRPLSMVGTSSAHDVSTSSAHDVSTCTAWLSAGHRIAFSSLSPPPPELVEVSSVSR